MIVGMSRQIGNHREKRDADKFLPLFSVLGVLPEKKCGKIAHHNYNIYIIIYIYILSHSYSYIYNNIVIL